MASFTGFEAIVRQDEPLAMHTWFQLGGPAEYFAEPRSEDELIALVKRCAEEGVRVRVLGLGSNLLVRDEGVPGLVLRLSDPTFAEIKVQGDRITAASGARLSQVITTAVHAGLGGIETLIGIPGTLGGAMRGNAGTDATDIGQWITSATVLNEKGETAEIGPEDLVFTYRSSNLDDLIVLNAELKLEEADPHELSKRLQKQWIVRKASQPMGHQCAGCVFKNPRGMRAGQLIEDAGLKGTRIGGAVVSDRHANFIVAEPECTSADVLRLIDLIKSQVEQRLDAELELEIEVW